MFKDLSPSRYERLLDSGNKTSGHGSRLAGIARSLRITHTKRTDREAEVVSTATGLVAPLAYLYTSWLLHAAVKRGIRRIYFLARDGQIFMKVARELVKNWNLEMELRYLYCSRESLLLPSFERMGEFERNWVSWGYLSSITVSEICRRLGLTLAEFIPFLGSGSLYAYQINPDQPFAKADLPALHMVLDDAGLAETVTQKTRSVFELTLSYLEQEGLLDDIPYALADTGWRGSSQYAISALMHKGNVRPQKGLTGFYVGLNCDTHCFQNDTLDAFLFDWRTCNRDYTLYYFICFEMLFAADHARTRCYRQEDGRVVPVLAEAPADDLLALIRTHHHHAVEFADRASHSFGFGAFDEEMIMLAQGLSRAFICSPRPVEAEVYGEWPIASEMCEGDFQRMAPPMSGMQFIRCALGMDKIKGYWPQASLMRRSCRLFCRAYNLFLRSGALDWYRQFLLRY